MISKSFLINELKTRSHDLGRNRELDQIIFSLSVLWLLLELLATVMSLTIIKLLEVTPKNIPNLNH